MANTFKKIQTVTVGSGGAATIDFTSIPQTYTDLKIVLSLRSVYNDSFDYLYIKFNNSTSNRTTRVLYGEGASRGSASYSGFNAWINAANSTASVFANLEFYIPNYTSANNKSYSVDSVTENNATGAYSNITAGLWADTSAITSISLINSDTSSNFAQYSTATLYGVANVAVAEGAKATGGVITADSQYFYHTFLSSATFTPSQSLSVDYLCVAGGASGGGGSAGSGGGGGGGGYRTGTLSLTSGAKTVTVGAGGVSNPNSQAGTIGNNSVFDSITSTGGGRGGYNSTNIAGDGGSGGGGGRDAAGGLGTAGQGSNGGSAGGTISNWAGGGGGGASGAGGNGSTNVQGNGGTGTASSISGTSVTYAGGGSGGAWNVGATLGTVNGGGGQGGRGTNPGAAGSINTGGGGGGGGQDGIGGQGGSGIVIVRYAR